MASLGLNQWDLHAPRWTWLIAGRSTRAPGHRRGRGDGQGNLQRPVLRAPHRQGVSLLLKACATGTYIKEATITHRKGGKTPQEYLIVKMNDILITGVTHSGTAGQPDTGSEIVSMSFSKVDFSYKPQNPNGSLGGAVTFKYDLIANKTF